MPLPGFSQRRRIRREPDENKIAIVWFESKLNQSITELNNHFFKFRISDALLTVYKLVWDDFCSWYLEIIKPEFGKPIDPATYARTIAFFETLLKLLHPFMPFITEELWHEFAERKEKDCIIVASWPSAGPYKEKIIDEAATAFEVITQIRNSRNAKEISPKEPLILLVKRQGIQTITTFNPVIQKLANLKNINSADEFPSNGSSFMVKSIELFILMEGKIDKQKETETLLKELDYTRGFLATVEKKLQNERFVSNAPPQVIETERKKKTDAEAKIKALEASLLALSS